MLPAFAGRNLHYNQQHNIFLTDGFTSAAGNTYFHGIRLDDRLAVAYSFGQGYCYLFLNGIDLYCWNGTNQKLISSEGYNCFVFNEIVARNRCVHMLRNFLAAQAKMLGKCVSEQEIDDFSEAMIDSVLRNRPPMLR